MVKGLYYYVSTLVAFEGRPSSANMVLGLLVTKYIEYSKYHNSSMCWQERSLLVESKSGRDRCSSCESWNVRCPVLAITRLLASAGAISIFGVNVYALVTANPSI